MRLNPIAIQFAVAALLCAGFNSSAETLKNALSANQIPIAFFSSAELAESINYAAASNESRTILAFLPVKGDTFVGPLRLIRFEKATGVVSQPNLKLDESDACSGSPLSITFVGNYTLLSVHLNPSAGCLLVFDGHFDPPEKLYGFGPIEVAPDQIVLIESMRHFAPTHPERLQLADLRRHITRELYPPQGDALRAQLIAEHARHMPSAQTCMSMNDPCDPANFDEDVRAVATDGHGQFSFLVLQSASHATREEQPPDTVVSQAVFYQYRQAKDGWLYCEQKISASEADALAKSLEQGFNSVATHCTPHLPVVPDMSTAGSNPFMKH